MRDTRTMSNRELGYLILRELVGEETKSKPGEGPPWLSGTRTRPG
jgi:hypothetical protein